MDSISCRSLHGKVNYSSKSFRRNYDGEVVDGKVVLTPRDVVSPSLASEYSVMMNSLTRNGDKPLRSRLNVDAVDLQHELNFLSN